MISDSTANKWSHCPGGMKAQLIMQATHGSDYKILIPLCEGHKHYKDFISAVN